MNSSRTLSWLVVSILLLLARPGLAAVDFYIDDEPGWIAAWEAVAGAAPPERIVYFETTAANIALANEVSSAPAPNTWLSRTLTFDPENTGLCHGFKLTARQSGASFTFDDDEGAGNVPDMDDALSVGDLDDYENDDFEISLNGPPIYALALSLTNSGAETGETLKVYGTNGALLGTLDASGIPSGTVSIGIVSDDPIRLARFDEGAGGDDIAFKALRFGDSRAYDSDGDGRSDCDGTGYLAFSSSGSDEMVYVPNTAGAALFPGAEYQGETTIRAAGYDSMSFPRFDESLGTLTGVRIEMTGTASTEHSRAGLCETLLLGLLCTFSISTETSTQFGFNIGPYDPGGADPLLIDGVPVFPTSDYWATQTWNSNKSWLGIAGDPNPPSTNGPVSFHFDLTGPSLAPFVGTGSYLIGTEMLSQTDLVLDCEIAILAVCEGSTRVETGFSFAATVTYIYDAAPGNVEFFVDDEAGWESQWEAAGTSQIARFPTDAAGIANAVEVGSPPGSNSGVGNTLTFEADPENACRAFEVRTLQSGSNFTFDDDEGSGNLPNFDDALSIGDIDNHQNDDFEISFPSNEPPVYAASFTLRDSHGVSGEAVRVYGIGNALIGALGGAAFGGAVNPTLSILSPQPISRIVFDEDSGGDDIAVANFAFDDARGNDSDSDGLNDCDEVKVHATNVFLADSDGDGLGDNDEASFYGTDPNASDSDLDGLSDGEETFVYGTNPLLADSDGDGTTDGDEVANGSDPLVDEGELPDPPALPAASAIARGLLAMLLALGAAATGMARERRA